MSKDMFKSSKRAQITIFIILGIILLFIAAIAIYWSNSVNKVRPPVQQLVVDDQLKPIQVYVTECLSKVSKDALIRLGQGGGYIEVPNGLHIDAVKVQNSDALLFATQTMPYWYYMKPCTDSTLGCLYIKNPPVCEKGTDCVLPYKGKDSVEDQLNTFIEKHLTICMNDFAPFKDRFDITVDEKKIEADTKISNAGVGFKVNYPLKIKFKDSEKSGEIPYFYTEHDVKLAEIYSFAQEIRDAEANYTFLERNTLNLISVYSGVDSSMLPPMSGLEMFTRSRKFWIRTEVEEKLKSDILPYTMLLQVVNAGNAKQIYSTTTDPKYIAFEHGLYDSMMLKVSNTTHFDLDANIYYPQDANIYFKIGDSEIIKPRDFDGGDNFVMKMMDFALNDYSFKYDLTYPVIVRISDPSAFNGEGYTFNYAMQANIRKNNPINKNFTTLTIQGDPTIDMEDIMQKVNKTITVETFDKYTFKPLGDVIITYSCGDDYPIGKTNLKNGKAVLSDKYPFCEFGGKIVYEKAGYMGGAIDYNNNIESGSETFKIELWPMQEKNVKVYKRTADDINSIRNVGAGGIVLFNTAYSELSENDSVFLNLARVKTNAYDSDVPLVGFSVIKSETIKTPSIDDQKAYVEKLFVDGSIDSAARDEMMVTLNTAIIGEEVVSVDTQDYKMEFVPGTYNVDAFMMYNGLINIPQESSTLCMGAKVLGICMGQNKDIVYPEQNFSSWIIGGVKTTFELTEDDVYNDNTLVIYVLEMPRPKDWETLQNTPTIEDYQADKLSLVMPRVE